MQRSNLAGVLLQLKALGIDNVLRFPFLSPPPAKSMSRGLELLFALGGLDEHCRLTDPTGIRMAELPLEPMQSKLLLTAGDFGCSLEIATIVAMLQVQNVFVAPPNRKRESQRARLKFSCLEGDHITLLNVYRFNPWNKTCGCWFCSFNCCERTVDSHQHDPKALD